MIYGVGIDIISLDKIRSICSKNRILLKDNLFSEEELDDAGIDGEVETLSNKQTCLLASKFAAKEATIKAIGLPHDTSFNWSDIIVKGKNNVSIETCRNIKTFIKQIGILSLNGSVSSSSSHSMAIVIGELL